MKLYLLRHGETDWNVAKRLQGVLDIPLNEKGRKLAALTGEGMKDIPFTAAFASELSRAYETAGIILQYNDCYRQRSGEYLNLLPEAEKEKCVESRGCRILRDCRLHEMDLGPWAGRYSSELPEGGLKRLREDPLSGVESQTAMLARAKDFLEDMTRRPELQDRRVLVVTHGGFMRSLLEILSGSPEFGKKLFLNCEAAIAEIDGRGRVLSLEKKLFYDPDLAFQEETY